MRIDKNMPIPPEPVDQRIKYPLGVMDVGDSFFSTEPRNRLQSVTHYRKKRYGQRFAIRAESNGFRVWRLA